MKAKQIVYVVGEVVDFFTASWMIVGVFTDEKQAVKSCKTENHFVGPIPIDKPFHKNKTKWTGAWYPKLENKPK